MVEIEKPKFITLTICLLFVIDIRIMGDDYRDKDFNGKAYCEEKGIEIYYNKRNDHFSSSGLKKPSTNRKPRKEVEHREFLQL